MQLEIKLDPELERLLEKLIKAVQDLTAMIGTATGYRVVPDENEQ